LRLATQRDELRIVRDQFGAPTRNLEIAVATTEILEQIADKTGGPSEYSTASGTYHMTAGGVTTWYDFAVAILEEASLAPTSLSWLTSALGGLPLRASRVIPIATEEYPTPARRPAYSVLSHSLLETTFGVKLPDWRVQLRHAFEDQCSGLR
jgi:dTDP-4-dehydrorhamnose reductase